MQKFEKRQLTEEMKQRLDQQDVERFVVLVHKLRDDQPNPEFAPLSCSVCSKSGYAGPCRLVRFDQESPENWISVPVCRACAGRGIENCFAYCDDALEYASEQATSK